MEKIQLFLKCPEDVKNYEFKKDKAGNFLCFTEDKDLSYKNQEIDKVYFKYLVSQIYAYNHSTAEYVGVAQENRFLALFPEKSADKPMMHFKFVDKKAVSGYGILNEKALEELLEKYDVILPQEIELKKLGEDSAEKFLKEKEKKYNTTRLERVEEAIQTHFPDYLGEFQKAKAQKSSLLYNIFWMKREYFLEYTDFLMTVLLEMYSKEKEHDYTSADQNYQISLLAAFLLSVYENVLKSRKNVRILETSLIEFGSVEREPEWLPAFPVNNVALVLSSSDYYVPYLATMLKSIMDNSTPANNYDITVLESSISDINKKLILGMVDKSNISIRFYNVNRKMDGIELKAGGHISVETYFRLLIPEIFIHYDKVLFLDSDMTAHADVAELFRVDVEGYTVAAAVDQCIAAFYNGSDKTFYPYCKKVLKLKNHHEYFQAGVMLLNLKRFRERYTTKEIFDFATSRQFTYVDQDIMNSLCRDEVKHIPLSWNVFPDFGDYSHEFMPEKLRQKYEYARNHIKICHHTGPTKPWTDPTWDILMTDRFWKYARKTPFYEIMLYRLNHAVSHEYIMLAKRNTLFSKAKGKVKNWVIMPLVNVFLPKGSKIRKKVKHLYFKLRGWEIPTWELGDKDE